MIALSLSLAACFGWGVADFLGGLKSRQLSVFSVLIVSSFFGLGAILVIILVRGVTPPDNPVLLVAVVGALYPAVTVLLSMLILRERPQPAQFIGIVLAVIGITFISTGGL